MKLLYTSASPPELLFNLCAAAVASLTLLLSKYFIRFRDIPKSEVITTNIISSTRLAGLELGGYLFLASTFQIYGLSYTTAGHSAFIVQLATVFAPLQQAVVSRKLPSLVSGVSCLLAFIGVLLLTSSANLAESSTNTAKVFKIDLC